MNRKDMTIYQKKLEQNHLKCSLVNKEVSMGKLYRERSYDLSGE